MIDYLFIFATEAAAKSALPAYWFNYGAAWTWDLSRIMAPTGAGNTQPFQAYMGMDVLDGYAMSVTTSVTNDALWSITQCMAEGDRDAAAILRTRFDDEQLQGFSVQPVMAGTSYLYPGRQRSLVLDQSQHPISDSDAGLLEG